MKILQKEERLLAAREAGLGTQWEFERLVDEAATIRLNKVKRYGEDRYSPRHSPEFNRMMSFSDIYRKYIRVENMMMAGLTEDPDTGESLRDTLIDMSNYALMAVQVLALPAPKEKPTPSPYFIEQVALACKNPDKLKHALRVIGLTEWATDEVVTRGRVFGGDVVETPATLNFNYQLGNFEFELLTYHNEDDNWLGRHEQEAGLSHMGLHVPDIDAAVALLVEAGYKIAQEVRTISHTNPHIKDSRRYRYMILDTREHFGFDLKLIQRLPLSLGEGRVTMPEEYPQQHWEDTNR
jgi:hypothetical protein